MINYAKEILSKVSFDKNLFKRELRKFLTRAENDQERTELKSWVVGKFEKKHPDTIKEAFTDEENLAA